FCAAGLVRVIRCGTGFGNASAVALGAADPMTVGLGASVDGVPTAHAAPMKSASGIAIATRLMHPLLVTGEGGSYEACERDCSGARSRAPSKYTSSRPSAQ